jgi:hypothetical protein
MIPGSLKHDFLHTKCCYYNNHYTDIQKLNTNTLPHWKNNGTLINCIITQILIKITKNCYFNIIKRLFQCYNLERSMPVKVMPILTKRRKIT